MKRGILEELKELRRIWGGFRASRVLITANNFRVFDYLKKPQTAGTISKKLKINLRATEILFDGLAGMGLLTKRENRYCNSDTSSHFLVTGTPYYQGDIIRHADTLWKNWTGLDEVLKTGKPYRKNHDQESFILGMHNNASLKAKDVIRMIGLKGVKTALDLGGGPGTYSIEMARKGLKVTLFDMPETIEIAQKIIQKSGAEGIRLVGGNFMSDDIGKGYDLIFISQILHAYSEKDNLYLLKKCRKSLNSEGKIVIHEFYLDKERTHPAQSALFSVNMLVNTEGGRCYPLQEIRSWLLKTGLKNLQEKMIDDSVLIAGQKSFKKL